MYALTLIIGTTVINIGGTFGTLGECQREALSLREQDVKAICIKQANPEEGLKQMMQMMQSMQKMMEK